MFFHKKIALLVLGIFLFTFSTGGVAKSQAPLKNPKAVQLSKKKWKVIDGFRSAKFGMSEKQVLRAIAKDFKISKSRVKQRVHPSQKVTALTIRIPNLIEMGGVADIVYILGYKSKKLIHVNIIWGVAEKVDGRSLIDTSNLLRIHFTKKKYKKERYVVNGRLNDISTIVFRGLDKKNRMALLMLTTPKANKGESLKKSKQKYMLQLSYILDFEKPDVFKAKAK
jgi:hypothetical protein